MSVVNGDDQPILGQPAGRRLCRYPECVTSPGTRELCSQLCPNQPDDQEVTP